MAKRLDQADRMGFVYRKEAYIATADVAKIVRTDEDSTSLYLSILTPRQDEQSRSLPASASLCLMILAYVHRLE